MKITINKEEKNKKLVALVHVDGDSFYLPCEDDDTSLFINNGRTVSGNARLTVLLNRWPSHLKPVYAGDNITITF